MSQDNTQTANKQSIGAFSQKAYLNYAMYVILDRALPHIGDGLKPVQRRIIYAMSQIGLQAANKPKKSARTVGDVLGKYHPHGDVACYEAMVLMAQPFSYRYPLIQGQGNWGSLDDPKSFAAMRYTEAKLSPYTQTLLNTLKQGAVIWRPNFDGTLQEPELLPAEVPNLLLNGASGIAVGMSTDIPPHNLKEVIDACIYVLTTHTPKLSTLLKKLPGPDYPGGGRLITDLATRKHIYETGAGALQVQATYHTEQQKYIVIDTLPYQVASSKLIQQIATEIQKSNIRGLVDVQDQSDEKAPVRIVLTYHPNQANCQQIMSELMAKTELQKRFRVNLNMIGTDGKPAVKPLIPLIQEWLEFRRNTQRRVLKNRLSNLEDRLHILQGLLVIFDWLEIVIEIIRESQNPAEDLCTKFDLTDTQAQAILNLRLRYLAKLQQQALIQEKEGLISEKQMIVAQLQDPAILDQALKKTLQQARQQYGDKRRTEIGAGLVTEQHRQSVESSQPVTLVISENQWIWWLKGQGNTQNKLAYKTADRFKLQAMGHNQQIILLFSQKGRSYRLDASMIPKEAQKKQGIPLTKVVNLNDSEAIQTACFIDQQHKSWFIFVSQKGYGFRCFAQDAIPRTRQGRQFMVTDQNDLFFDGIWYNKQANKKIALVSAKGYLLVIPVQHIDLMKKGKGKRLMTLVKTDQIQFITCIEAERSLLIYAGKRHLRIQPVDHEKYQTGKASSGQLLPRGFQQVTSITSEA